MKSNQTLKQVPLLKDYSFVAVVSNLPMPCLAPLGTSILFWLTGAGIFFDASGFFFNCWFCASCVEQVGRRAWWVFCANTGSCF
jgi:hypothetical protein